MPAPYFNRQQALLEARAEIFYSKIACDRDPNARDQAKVFAALLAEWEKVFKKQLEHWDAQIEADFGIHGADAQLDDDIDAFDRALQASHPEGRSSPVYLHYLETRPAALKRPVLGPELETVRAWLPSLQHEEDAAIKRFYAVFTKDVSVADVAVEAQQAADAANSQFRERGALAAFFNNVVVARDKVYATLEKRRTDKPELNLPREFASQVFRPRSEQLSDEAKKARAQAKADARKEAQELAQKKREAREKLREAQRALAALKK